MAIALHWVIAVLIIYNLSLGFFMEGFAPPLKRLIIPMHISSGMTVLLLTILRIVWRWTHRPPAFTSGMTRWETASAHAAHVLIYVLMLAMPLTGWSIISAHPLRPGAGANVWGLFLVPPITPIATLSPTIQPAVHERFVEAHTIGGWIFVALLLLHVAGALKHQLMDKHPELARMGLGRMPN